MSTVPSAFFPVVQGDEPGRVAAGFIGVVLDALVDDAPLATVAPEIGVADHVVRDPDGIMMAVPNGVAWVAHARQRSARETHHRKQERPLDGWAVVIADQLATFVLKRVLAVGLRHDLIDRHRLGRRQIVLGGAGGEMG
ncbi:MAG TPA: hypothetical protein VHZ24_04530 [Pirellulales bacterium]|jgi:hypothetical protein|nr:hypothetical protein [Pirellulales bacterium]